MAGQAHYDALLEAVATGLANGAAAGLQKVWGTQGRQEAFAVDGALPDQASIYLQSSGSDALLICLLCSCCAGGGRLPRRLRLARAPPGTASVQAAARAQAPVRGACLLCAGAWQRLCIAWWACRDAWVREGNWQGAYETPPHAVAPSAHRATHAAAHAAGHAGRLAVRAGRLHLGVLHGWVQPRARAGAPGARRSGHRGARRQRAPQRR